MRGLRSYFTGPAFVEYKLALHQRWLDGSRIVIRPCPDDMHALAYLVLAGTEEAATPVCYSASVDALDAAEATRTALAAWRPTPGLRTGT